MIRTLLIDADLLAYQSSSATQRAYKWDGDAGEVSVAASLSQAIEAAERAIASLIDRLQPDNLTVCLSDDFRSFRKELVDPTYKEQRVATERPVHLYDLKDWMRDTYEVEERPLLEADDVMGIIATDPSRTDERIIVSADKDMMTIPGLLYQPHRQTDAKGRMAKKPVLRNITELEAVRFHFWQTIVGDTTDGFPGVPGVGPKSPYAEDVLTAETEEEAWDEVLMAFGTKGLTEEDAVRQARMARILQYDNYSGSSVILWKPPYSGISV